LSREAHQGLRTGEGDARVEKSPDPELVRDALASIIASPEFDATDRNRRFLSYVVTEALEGRGDRIKAYTIATEVFGRGPSFDPQGDPIVRVEAGQLRRALDRYYLDAGRDDPVEISIPKGGYAPLFTPRERVVPIPPPEPAAPAPPRRVTSRAAVLIGVLLALFLGAGLGYGLWAGRAMPARPDIPRILVQPFEDLARSGNSALLASGLTQEVIGQISRFRDIVVIAADAEGRPLADSSGLPAARDAPRYLLSGSLDIDGTTLRLQTRLISRGDGAVLWTNKYAGDLSVSRLTAIKEEIGDEVATALAQPDGVIFRADAARQVTSPPEDWTAYACTLAYYDYRLTFDAATHARIRSCLEDAVARFPTYATAWALLSLIYIDELRYRFPPETSGGAAPIEKARAAARTAVSLDPTNIRGREAEMFSLYFSGDKDAAIEVGKAALELNPNDTQLMGEYGYRLALSGEWEAGCALVDEARKRQPGRAGYYETALGLCAYQRGDYATAAIWIRKVPMTDNPQYHAIATVIFAELGDPQVAAEVEWLRVHAPQYFQDARSEIAYRIGRKQDVDRILASLKKAGIPAKDH